MRERSVPRPDIPSPVVNDTGKSGADRKQTAPTPLPVDTSRIGSPAESVPLVSRDTPLIEVRLDSPPSEPIVVYARSAQETDDENQTAPKQEASENSASTNLDTSNPEPRRGPGRPMTEANKALLARLRAGETPTDIARDTGLPYARISALWDRARYSANRTEPKQKSSETTHDERKAARDERLAMVADLMKHKPNITAQEVTQTTGIPLRTATRDLQALRPPTRPERRTRLEKAAFEDKIRDTITGQKDPTFKGLQKTLGISKPYLSRLLHKLGYTVQKNKIKPKTQES